MIKNTPEEIIDVVKSWLVWKDWNDAQRQVLNDILSYMDQVEEFAVKAENLEKEKVILKNKIRKLQRQCN